MNTKFFTVILFKEKNWHVYVQRIFLFFKQRGAEIGKKQFLSSFYSHSKKSVSVLPICCLRNIGQRGLGSVGGKKSRNLLWRGDARREVLFNFERTIKIEKNDIFAITPNMLFEELGQYGLESVGGKKSRNLLWRRDAR